ncbi:MAG: Beta-L-arabinofuranosidase-like protein [Microbacteriaceae bacterium]|nr:Beta-L-arabinofuranosidase-like protein [Microbacteriaceae bacterium]
MKTSYSLVHPRGLTLGGWLEHQARTALGGYVGAMPQLSTEVGGDVFASGRLGPDSSSSGSNVANIEWWNGESEGNWLLAWVTHATVLHDSDALVSVGKYLERILAAQGEDGYIGMFTDRARAERIHIGGDLWTQSRVLRALQIWAIYTEADDVWESVDRALAYTHARYEEAARSGEAFAKHTGDSCGRGHDLMMVEVLIEQISHAFNPDLLHFASTLYADFSQAELDWPDADGQLWRLLSEEPAIGHGAHTAEHLRIPLLLAAFTGNPELQAAFDSGYQKVRAAIGVGGALKSDETIGSPGSYPVPLPESGYEFCAMTELTLSLLEAARITGDFGFVDQAEHLFLNSAQAAIAKDGRSVAYLVAENQIEASHRLGTRWDYSPTHDDVAVCCAPNAGRILPIVAERMILQTPRGLSVQLFGPMSVVISINDRPVLVTQETSFPFDERVEVHIDPESESEFDVEVRIPAWCEEATLTVTGAEEVTEIRQSDRLRFSARWLPGSVIVVELPHHVRTVSTSDGRTSLAAGPLVYSLPVESAATPHRDYEQTGYADLDLVRTSAAVLYPPALVGSKLHDVATEFTNDTSVSPWSEPTLALVAQAIDPNPKDDAFDGSGEKSIRLVPLGATTLRWTAFPVTGRYR